MFLPFLLYRQYKYSQVETSSIHFKFISPPWWSFHGVEIIDIPFHSLIKQSLYFLYLWLKVAIITQTCSHNYNRSDLINLIYLSLYKFIKF